MNGTPTPLPSQWDSAIIRQLLYAALGLLATVLADVFGLSTEAFLAKGGRVIDAVLGVLVIAIPLYLAWRARRNLPTPPIAGTDAVTATAVREEKIALAPPGQKENIAAGRTLSGYVLAVGLAGMLVGLLGCTGLRGAYSEAAQHPDAPAALAYVIGEHYRATVEEAARLKNAGVLTGAKLEAVREAELEAAPYIVGGVEPAGPDRPGLLDLAETYQRVRTAETEAELQEAIGLAAVKLRAFIQALK